MKNTLQKKEKEVKNRKNQINDCIEHHQGCMKHIKMMQKQLGEFPMHYQLPRAKQIFLSTLSGMWLLVLYQQKRKN